MSVRSYTDRELTDLIVSDLDQGIIAFTNQYKEDCLRFIASKLRHPDSALMSDYEHEDIFMNCLAITFENIQNQKYKFDSLKFMMAVELQYIHEDSCDWLLRFSWLLGL